MDKKNTVTIRLTDEQFGWLRALSRRSKRSQSEVVRSLIEHGTVRERITNYIKKCGKRVIISENGSY